MDIEAKVAHLRRLLAEAPSALIAFSGGVDSSFLLHVAHEVLGERCLALTTVSATTPAHDLDQARRLATALGVEHLVIDTDELAIPGYAENPTNRCYFCKDNLFTICSDEANRRGVAVVFDGANVDDLRDHRPGLRAAAERAVRHPLIEAGLSKADVRLASRARGLATWDRPASPCLSSRFPYGTRITRERLDRVAAAEEAVRACGLGEFRVRFHDTIARLELRVDDMPRILDPDTRATVVEHLKRLGFAHVVLDLQGFRSGSLNDVVPQKHEGPEGFDPPAPRIR